jgi:hypothetical protein
VPGTKPECSNRPFEAWRGLEGRSDRQTYDSGQGRWPANFIHDGSDEVHALFPDVKTNYTPGKKASSGYQRGENRWLQLDDDFENFRNSGSAARFFYCSKPSTYERNTGLPAGMTNKHPTVKPVSLMRYLCKLVTQPGGIILDPFMGSGSTGLAASIEGFHFIGIELDEASFSIAEQRLKAP